MKKLAELRALLAQKKKAAIAFLDLMEAEDRNLTDAEQIEYDGLKAEITETEASIARIEQSNAERRALGPLAPQFETMVNEPNPETTHGFKSIAEFALSVRGSSGPGASVDTRLIKSADPSNVHQGGGSSGEGFEVPPEYADGIWEVVQETDEFGPLVDEEPTSKRQVEGTSDETTPWGSSGVVAFWRKEGTKMDPSKMAENPTVIILHELYAFILASEELLSDSPRLGARITNKAGQAISWKKNDAMVQGDGAGQPLGWMNSGALISIPKVVGQGADTIVALNIINMFSRLLVIPGDMPFWLVNRDCLAQLMTLVLGDKPLWMPANGIADAPGGFILGYPVRFSEHSKTLGDKGDIQLISPKGYHALKRTEGPKFAQSMHLYFDYNLEAFRWTFRFGGQPHLSKPVSPANGSATKSHFITLDERT